MTSNLVKLTVLSIALGLAACATTPQVVDNGAVKDQCRCACKWTTVDGSQATGTLAFETSDQACPYTAIDNYVPCKDDQGGVHPGTSYTGCQFVPGVLPPTP